MNLANWAMGDIFLFIFGLMLLSSNIEALINFRKVHNQVKDIKEEDLAFNSKLHMFTILLVGAFIFKGIIYIIAYVFIGHFLILITGGILFLLRLYIILRKLDHSDSVALDFLTLLGETLFVIYFIIHYFVLIL